MSSMSRRTLLRSAAVAGAAVSVPGLLSGCTTSKSGDVSNAGKKLAAWPTYKPAAGPAPQLPPTAAGVQAGYTAYPANLTSAVAQTPGDGSTISVMSVTFGTPPKPEAQNRYWQAIEKALGVKINYTVISQEDYQTKMPTVMAGDTSQLPDIINMFSGYVLPREAQFVQAVAQDLSPHLSGDAVAAYPNLANLPTAAWRDMGRIAGSIYGVPLERPLPGSTLYLNQTMFADAGMTEGWTNQDFASVAHRATHGRTYALGAAKGSMFNNNVHAAAFNAPQGWAVDKSGNFHAGYLDERFRDAIAFQSQLRQAGSYYPNSTSLSTSDATTYLLNGTIGSVQNGFQTYQTLYASAQGLMTPAPGLPYSVNGTPGGYVAARRSFGYTILKKAGQARIQMLLRLLDYLAAPFGSKEWELIHYGLEGVHFTRTKDGSPKLNDLGKVEGITNLPFKYLAEGPQVLFLPGMPDVVTALHTFQQKVVPVAIRNASFGLQSDTANSQSAVLTATMTDTITSVIAGRADLSAFDAAVKQWRSQGGDKMAAEYAEDYAASA